LFHQFGKRHLVLGADRNFLQRRHACAGNVHKVSACGFEAQREIGGFFGRPAAFHPIGGRNAHAQRTFVNRPHRLKHLQRKTNPAFKIAAIAVAALVRQGRQKLMQQITVRRMQFHRINAHGVSTLRGVHKGLANIVQTLCTDGVGRCFVGQVRHG
jgi:hypothetical protein